MRIHIGNITIILRGSLPSISVKTKNRLYSVDTIKGWYSKDYRHFKKMMVDDSGFPLHKSFPCLTDREDSAGFITNPYFQQDMYVARKIFQNNPQKHVDVGSRLDGFVAHVAVFREIEVFDIRPMQLELPNIVFTQADFTNGESLPADYCDSVSCLHALEHFGLGRYGDKIDPEGHLKGFRQISKILKPGGTFYFSVPMGEQRIEFNAHRVFGMPYLMKWVMEDYTVASFAYIDDNCELHEDVVLNDESIERSFGCDLGCAIFELKKKDK